MKAHDKDFFVGIYDPLDVRRNLLESSKELIKSLDGSEKLHQIRQQKLRKYKEMKAVMEELNLLIEKLKKRLPKSHLRKATQKRVRKIKLPHLDSAATGAKFSAELEKLEKELRSVEKTVSSFK